MKSLIGSHLVCLVTAMGVLAACSQGGPSGKLVDGQGVPAPGTDIDGDALGDRVEDRNRNGRVDPGETDPERRDSDGDGIPDGDEVMTIACSPVMDRPFRVYDAPGTGSMILVDVEVSTFGVIRTFDNYAPAFAVADDTVDVAAVIVRKRPSMGASTPADQREFEKRNIGRVLGQLTGQQSRQLTTIEGFAAERATWIVRASQDFDARGAVNAIASGMLGGVRLEGLLAAGGISGRTLKLQLLTVYRSNTDVVFVAAVAVGSTLTEPQELRLDELTDGTNLARRRSFTRHSCDQFKAEAQARADIIFVVDDSGSMEDDQMAVRAAADAMEGVLQQAQIDFRLGVTRTRARDRLSLQRGTLERPGLTADIAEFKRAIVVGADGGWEPGLDTGVKAIDRLLPRTSEGAAADPNKLREGAATVVIHLSDERDQTVECMACGGCDQAEGEARMCTGSRGQSAIDDFITKYTARKATTFAIVGDLPNGCRQGSEDNFEPGQGYVEVANATGGKFGSLCGDMTTNLRDVARVASGVASAYRLTTKPASASLRVAIGPPGGGRAIARSRTDGFDYDPVQNSVIFYGAARPKDGDEVVIGYRRWDWANNPLTPPDGCDECEMNESCRPDLDTVECGVPCGEVECEPGLACLETTGMCGEPSDDPIPPSTACGECGPGLVCDEAARECIPPCESTGCGTNEICNSITHLCEVPSL